MAIALSTLALTDIAPDSITPDQQANDCMAALDPELRARWPEVEIPAVLHRLRTRKISEMGASERVQLDHVARWFDAPSWNTSWSLTQKRRVLFDVIRLKRRMGTLAAVKDALATIGASCVVTEWWQEVPKGTPHTFRVQVILSGNETVTRDKQDEVYRLICAAKPVRSQFTFEIMQAVSGGKVGEAVLRTMAAARLRND